MNVSSVGNSQYIQKSSSVKTNNETSSKDSQNYSSIDNHKLEGLDDRGNAILNQLLEGKTEREKMDIQVVMDGMMIFGVNHNSSGIIGDSTMSINKDTSEESIINKLNEKIYKFDNLPTMPDKYGIEQIFRDLTDLYKSGYSPLDTKV